MKIGIDLGGTNIRMGVVENGNVSRKIAQLCKANEPENIVIDQIKSMIREIISPDITSIGIGVPSVVDAERGIVYNVMNIPSWKEVHLKEILEEEFKIPVSVNNDCNCFALGEAYYGEAIGYKDAVCLALGTGVGAGIIIDGKLYNGGNTGAGEIGSLPYLEYDYESYCSSSYFTRVHGTTGKEAFDKATSGDPEALEIWKKIGIHIGNLVKVILFTYDPSIIVMGGSISNAYSFFAPTMMDTLKTFPYTEIVAKLQIRLSTKEDISILGASLLH
ncbi:ROK family protein [Dysgonomonas sp. Marseille-P4677]|uniref:ROK family protein n=1 Tax=Dysgonomonas sp. Marseille-P4677 TaxID=2364790 RepID=UPI001913490C|nr:ROK family protein [Dysgonomonas sp. Marseille-P4677]MBK5721213.1 ROK family protein [Dysgonomonas sp. Marseille-P4677]